LAPITARLRTRGKYQNYARQSLQYRQVFGFTWLLRDVYGHAIRLSHILLRQGSSLKQAGCWQRDSHWQLRFLRRLRLKLLILLRNALPACDPFVISAWYALDGEGKPSIAAIAQELKLSHAQVRDTQHACLAYLRSAKGRAAWRKQCGMRPKRSRRTRPDGFPRLQSRPTRFA
jgi:hypothetical protein